jgi:hypothetical protein
MDDKGNYNGGVVFRFGIGKKTKKEERKMTKYGKQILLIEGYPRFFCRDTILKYLPLKCGEINGFILRYTPGNEEFMLPGFNLALYLNKCYKAYKELPLQDSIKGQPALLILVFSFVFIFNFL